MLHVHAFWVWGDSYEYLVSVLNETVLALTEMLVAVPLAPL